MLAIQTSLYKEQCRQAPDPLTDAWLHCPGRAGTRDEVQALAGLLGRLDLRPVDRFTAELAAVLSSRYRLRATVATHPATAVGVGADRFIANNQRDFPAGITEIHITYPADLPDPIG